MHFKEYKIEFLNFFVYSLKINLETQAQTFPWIFFLNETLAMAISANFSMKFFFANETLAMAINFSYVFSFANL